MGIVIPNGYHVVVPSLTVSGSTHTCQVALMGKTKAGDGVSATLAAWRSRLVAGSAPLNAAQMYVGWSLVGMKCSQMDAGVLTVAEDLTAIAGTKTGSNGGSMNISILTKKVTGIAGRRYRGRCMWPDLWVPESGISQAGIIDSTNMTLVNDLMTNYNVALASYGINEYLGHSVSEVAPTQFLTPMVCVQRVGTIKRRIRGS